MNKLTIYCISTFHLDNIYPFYDLLSAYKDQTGKNKDDFLQQPCNTTTTESRPKGEKQCYFDLTKLGPCYSNSKDFTYGYKDGAPCFYLRMNRVCYSFYT